MGERVGPWWMPCPCHADECPPHYSSFHHSVMMHLMIIILKNMMEMEIFMMKRYQILIIHPQHQHHRHHQVTNNKTPLATCIVWGTLWYEVHLLMPGSLCQHEDFIHTIGLMVDQLLSIWTLFCCSLIVVLQIIMNIIFLTIAISVIYPVITIINMIFVTSQHQDWSLTTSWWLSDFFWHIPISAAASLSYICIGKCFS